MGNANLDEARKQFVKSPKAAEEALPQMTEVPGEASSLISQMSKCISTNDKAISSATEQSRQARVLEARISLLEDKLNLLKQKKSTSCSMKAMCRKTADAKRNMND